MTDEAKVPAEEAVAAAKANEEQQEKRRIRASALTMAEYQNKEDPEIIPLVAATRAAHNRLKELDQEFQKANTEFLKAREALERKLEPHIPEELRIFD